MEQPTQSESTTGAMLRLGVFDEDDLAVVSAHLQDAEVTLHDIAYLTQTKRLALVVSRFDWIRAGAQVFERCQTGLHFERVLAASFRGLDRADPERPHRLLAISFAPTDPPSGTVLLTFADGAAIRLTVECLEAEMRDLGPRWSVEARPATVLDDAPASG